MINLTIALPKGRLLDDAISLLKVIGLDCSGLKSGRQLVLTDDASGVKFILVKPFDVVIYVEHGVADLGIVGKDVLLEERRHLYELLDLGFGKCRIVLAGPSEWAQLYSKQTLNGTPRFSSVRIATKFPNTAGEFCKRKGLNAEIIVLRGAVELAPITGLSDAIVDLVSTGNTLRANGLVEVEEIACITARLIANSVSYRLKSAEIQRVVRMCKTAIAKNGAV